MAVQLMLSGSERELGRFERWVATLTARGFDVIPHVFDAFERAPRVDQDAFVRQTVHDIRRADVLWVLYPEHPSCDALYALGFARALREQEVSRVHLVVTTRGRAPWAVRALAAASAHADYRAYEDDLGFHDITNAAQRIIMSRSLASVKASAAPRWHEARKQRAPTQVGSGG